MYIHIDVCIYIYRCVYTYIYVCVYINTYIYIYVCKYIHTLMNCCKYIRTLMNCFSRLPPFSLLSPSLEPQLDRNSPLYAYLALLIVSGGGDPKFTSKRGGFFNKQSTVLFLATRCMCCSVLRLLYRVPEDKWDALDLCRSVPAKLKDPYDV